MTSSVQDNDVRSASDKGLLDPRQLPPRTADDNGRPNRIDILLEEYKTLRAESLQGIQARHQVVTFTFGALSVMTAAILASHASALLLGFIAYCAIPQIAKAGLLMWLGEYRRSARAGRGLRAIEQEINGLTGGHTLSWETSLSKGRSHMTFPYAATAFIVLLVSYLSLTIGISHFTTFAIANPLLDLTQLGLPVRPIQFTIVMSVVMVAGGLTIVAAIIEICFLRFFWRLWLEVRFSNYQPIGTFIASAAAKT
jgi:hypothetical protein